MIGKQIGLEVFDVQFILIKVTIVLLHSQAVYLKKSKINELLFNYHFRNRKYKKTYKINRLFQEAYLPLDIFRV